MLFNIVWNKLKKMLKIELISLFLVKDIILSKFNNCFLIFFSLYFIYILLVNGIVGGGPALFKNVPYHVAVIINNSGLCSGAIIHPLIILTCAHCYT